MTVLRLWDPLRSIELVKLANIAWIWPSGTPWALILRHFGLRFHALGIKIYIKIDFRIINFRTWVPGRLPGGPWGVPRGVPGGPSTFFRHRFWDHFWCKNLLIFELVFGLEKSELRERILMDFGHVLGGRTLRIYCIYNKNQWFFIFELVGFRERFWHQKAFKMNLKWVSKPFQNEARNEVWNRGGFEWWLRIDFPGFG